MKTKLFDNLWLKVLSVAAAIILWLVVVNIDDAITYRRFTNIKVTTTNMEAITSQGQTVRVEEGTDTVNLTVYARRSVLDKLKSSDFVATADMQKDLSYDSMVKIEVTYTGNYTIDRIEQDRTNLLVSIEESLTEQFKVSVRTTGTAADGLVVVSSSLVPEKAMIDITGPSSVVERVKSVVAEVDITGITGTTTLTCRLKLLNSDGNEIDGTYLTYTGKDEDFSVTVTPLSDKLVGISFDVSEAAPEGYGLAPITYKPETVTIAGQRSDIAGISNLEIPAEALNPDGLTGTVEQTVDISQYLDDGIVIPDTDEQLIAVTMEIVPLVSEVYTISADQVQYSNIPEGYTLDVSESDPLEITVSGIEASLAGLTADQITVTADLSEITRAGTHTVTVSVSLPDGFSTEDEPELTLRLVRADAD